MKQINQLLAEMEGILESIKATSNAFHIELEKRKTAAP